MWLIVYILNNSDMFCNEILTDINNQNCGKMNVEETKFIL